MPEHKVVKAFSIEEVCKVLPFVRQHQVTIAVEDLRVLATQVNQHMKVAKLKFPQACQEVFAGASINFYNERGGVLQKVIGKLLGLRSAKSLKAQAARRRKKKTVQSKPAPKSRPRRKEKDPPRTRFVGRMRSKSKRMAIGEQLGQGRFRI